MDGQAGWTIVVYSVYQYSIENGNAWCLHEESKTKYHITDISKVYLQLQSYCNQSENQNHQNHWHQQ